MSSSIWSYLFSQVEDVRTASVGGGVRVPDVMHMYSLAAPALPDRNAPLLLRYLMRL